MAANGLWGRRTGTPTARARGGSEGMSRRTGSIALGVLMAAVANVVVGVTPPGQAAPLPRTARLATQSAPQPMWATMDIDGGRSIADVTCPSARLCVAVDGHGDVLTTARPAQGAVAWHSARIDHRALAGVTCPSVRLCVAYDEQGGVALSTRPDGGPGAWQLTASRVPELSGMACTSARLCVAGVGYGPLYGDIAVSTHPGGGARAWTLTRIDGQNAVVSVACPTTSLCVAGDDLGSILTSPDPSDGGRAWRSSASDPNGDAIVSLSCPSIRLCAAATAGGYGNDDFSDIMVAGDPAQGSSWRTFQNIDSNQMAGVACASRALCVGADGSSSILTSTRPLNRGSWTSTTVPGGFQTLSCPTVRLCVAIDGSGSVYVSTNPSAGG